MSHRTNWFPAITLVVCVAVFAFFVAAWLIENTPAFLTWLGTLT